MELNSESKWNSIVQWFGLTPWKQYIQVFDAKTNNIHKKTENNSFLNTLTQWLGHYSGGQIHGLKFHQTGKGNKPIFPTLQASALKLAYCVSGHMTL